MDQQLHKLHALELEPVLELIGVVLENDNDVPMLKVCCLVNREWHRVFAPFLWWRVVDDFDKVLKRLYRTKYDPDLGLAAIDPDARMEPEYLALMDDFVQKVTDPSTPSAIHRRRRTHLCTSSLISFVVLGGLLDQIRVISYSFKEPPQFGIYDYSLREMVTPENCRMSNQYWKSKERVDNITTVLENCPLLRVLWLRDMDSSVYADPHEWLELSSARTCTGDEPFLPRWPMLRRAVFEGAMLDRHYLEIFLHNCPSLRSLHLSDIKFSVRGDMATRHIFPDPTLNEDTSQDPCQSDDPVIPYVGLEDLVMWNLGHVSHEEQLGFALRLPVLKKFSFRLDPTLSSVRLFYKPGFPHLTSLTLSGDLNHEVLIRAAHRLKYLKLEASQSVNEVIFETIARHHNTLETVIIDSRVLAIDLGEGPHRILRTCHRLLELSIHMPVLNCNPEKFRDHPWVCTHLRSLTIIPDCVPKNTTYTPFQAQAAFFEQLASTCLELQSLSFGGGTGSNDFQPHEGLELLLPLTQLEVLNLQPKSIATNAQLTEEHGKLVVSEWPKLRAIGGLYHYACRPFVAYVQEHRPEVDLSF
ncbi:hypothetical protein BGZ95_008268 [Linnemannia exigua]|uniref:F-box domain-containing protein n=1 Tax=Linnemannia exigua TaxID=604196 RepID=A0AAD4DEG2_9FUNG|nr:hypothetical protein BGZ95_008268 [Linnemannia exigua]